MRRKPRLRSKTIVELACGSRAAVFFVFTITYVAKLLGEDEDWFHELSLDMDPEDGRIYVCSGTDKSATAFTEDGIENLKKRSLRTCEPTAALLLGLLNRVAFPRRSPEA